MTVPAVVRRWSEPAPDPGHTGRSSVLVPALAASWRWPWARMAGSVLRDQLVRVRRVAPLGAVFLTGLMLQAAVAPHLAVRGSAPDVLLVAVAAVAVGRGPRAGAGFGFAAGVGADLFLATPLGTSALAYTLVGHVLGDRCRPGPSGTAAALCSPASTCFACRTGRRHPPLLNAIDGDRPVPASARRRRRVAVRRGGVRRSIGLTGLAVGGGRLATAVVATALGGLPHPGALGLLRIVGVAAGSALLGPVAFAAVRRLPGTPVGRGALMGRRPW
ncbi:MAG: rod shape-determining protein MreD [Actinomycetota bacterium]|nr:rod shape-determining protein MreD [Actinomycetota bacterium]